MKRIKFIIISQKDDSFDIIFIGRKYATRNVWPRQKQKLLLYQCYVSFIGEYAIVIVNNNNHINKYITAQLHSFIGSIPVQ